MEAAEEKADKESHELQVWSIFSFFFYKFYLFYLKINLYLDFQSPPETIGENLGVQELSESQKKSPRVSFPASIESST